MDNLNNENKDDINDNNKNINLEQSKDLVQFKEILIKMKNLNINNILNLENKNDSRKMKILWKNLILKIIIMIIIMKI